MRLKQLTETQTQQYKAEIQTQQYPPSGHSDKNNHILYLAHFEHVKAILKLCIHTSRWHCI